MVDGKADHWLPYVCGCTVALAVHSVDEPFTRGAAYVWCKRVIENGNVMFPTSPLFGRFIELAGSRLKVLAGKGVSAMVGEEYAYCFRAVGVLHGERQFFPCSEVPVPVPSEAERIAGPAAFGTLQYTVKHLAQTIASLCDVTDTADELIVAEKKIGDLKTDARVEIEARAYRSLQPILNAAMRESGQVDTELADYLKQSPSLAYWLKRPLTLLFFALFWNGILSVFLTLAWIAPIRRGNLIRHGHATTGTIVSTRTRQGKGMSYYAKFRYRNPEDGNEIEREMQLSGMMDYEAAKPGKPVTVLYSERNPRRAIIYEFSGYKARSQQELGMQDRIPNP